MAKVMYGYGNTMLTWSQMDQKSTWIRLHPEMRRRFKALVEHLATRGVVLGVGTGWRVQPANKPGFASPGNSWHEGVPVESKANALAIDTVPASSWDAMEAELARFGLRSFRHVNNEPWHIQLIEIPAGRKYATTLPPIKTWNLPQIGTGGGEPTTPTPPTTTTNYDPAPQPTLKEGSSGPEVVDLQNQCNFWGWGDVGKADGQFGPRTKAAVQEMQTVLKLTSDGIYGPQSAKALQSFLKGMSGLAGGDQSGGTQPDNGSYKPGDRTLKVQTPKMRGSDVKWVQETLRGQGLQVTVDSWYGNDTKQKVQTMQGWNNLTKDGVVGPKTWAVLKQY